MPGKPVGFVQPFFPGNNEYKAFDEGWTARYGLQAENTNPFDPVARPREWLAWAAGWQSADGNSGGERLMPAISGVPGALP